MLCLERNCSVRTGGQSRTRVKDRTEPTLSDLIAVAISHGIEPGTQQQKASTVPGAYRTVNSLTEFMEFKKNLEDTSMLR